MLAYYKTEHEEFGEEYGKLLTNEDAEFFVKKLSRRFGVDYPEGANTIVRIGKEKHRRNSAGVLVTFNLRTGNAKCSPELKWIQFTPTPSLGIVIHECAHLGQIRENNKDRRHNKKHKVMMKRMAKYCKKMNYWGIKYVQ